VLSRHVRVMLILNYMLSCRQLLILSVAVAAARPLFSAILSDGRNDKRHKQPHLTSKPTPAGERERELEDSLSR